MRRPLLVACLALLCAAASALAQGPLDEGTFVTAVGPDAQGVQLDVQMSRGDLCVGLVDHNHGGGSGGNCSDLPRVDLFDPFVVDAAFERDDGTTPVGGAVRAVVARVEFVLADGRRAGVDTVTAPQVGGRAGRELRFYLITLAAAPVTRRLFDAGGRLLAEEDGPLEPMAGSVPRRLRGPARLARGRSGGARWSLYAAVRNELEPVRGDAGRRVPRLCLSTGRDGGAGGCEPGLDGGFTFHEVSGCPGRRASLVVGLAAPGARVEALLGDGHWRAARLVSLPAGYAPSGERAYVFEIPSDAAVRRLRARTRCGRVLGEVRVSLAPPRLTCQSGSVVAAYGIATDVAPVFTGPEAVLRPSGGAPLTVRDADPLLCVAVGAAARERTCQLPTPGLAPALVASSRDGRVAGGAVDPGIASVEAIASDGSRRRVATDPGAGYAGRYAGLVRFFSVEAPPGAVLDSIALRDATGHRILEWPIRFEFERVGSPRVLVTERAAGGRFDVMQARFRFAGQLISCLAVERHGRSVRDPFGCIGLAEGGDRLPASALAGMVRCDLRAVILVGGASRRAAAVRARLDDGSTVAGRLFGSSLGRAFVLTPPAGRGM